MQSEDEALAMAIARSMQDHPPSSTSKEPDRPEGHLAAGGGGGYDEDAAMAQAIALSLQEQEKKVCGAMERLCCLGEVAAGCTCTAEQSTVCTNSLFRAFSPNLHTEITHVITAREWWAEYRVSSNRVCHVILRHSNTEIA